MERAIKIHDNVFRIVSKDRSDDGVCKHYNTALNEHGQSVVCDDCGESLSPFWVLKNVLESISNERIRLDHEWSKIKEERNATVKTKAAKAVEKAWTARNHVPTCPHCHRGIMATDCFGGSMVERAIEQRRRDIEYKEITKND